MHPRLSNDLFTKLPPDQYTLLTRIAALADAHATPIWLVGGLVRDLLAGHHTGRDLDLAVAGDAVALAQTMATELEGRIEAAHQEFGTASVVFQGTARAMVVDLARTRSETYAQPAALPVVQPADIQHDLARRDFSINALALEVRLIDGHPGSGHLLDLFGGQADLQAGLLRVLHERSFIDDPTRMLRGVRLAARLNMRFEPQTRALLADALAGGYLEATTPDRVRTELCLALEEPRPLEVLQQANEHGITAHIFAPLQTGACAACDPALLAAQPPPVRAGLLSYELDQVARDTFATRYRLPNEWTRLLHEVDRLRDLRAELRRPTLPNSELDRLLRPFSAPALHTLQAAESGDLGAAITHYLENLRPGGPALNGHDLQRLGVPPGPRLGALLADLRAAHLDGLVATREEQETWVRQQLAQEGPP